MITDKYSIKLKGHEHFFFFMQIIGIRRSSGLPDTENNEKQSTLWFLQVLGRFISKSEKTKQNKKSFLKNKKKKKKKKKTINLKTVLKYSIHFAYIRSLAYILYVAE